LVEAEVSHWRIGAVFHFNRPNRSRFGKNPFHIIQTQACHSFATASDTTKPDDTRATIPVAFLDRKSVSCLMARWHSRPNEISMDRYSDLDGPFLLSIFLTEM
jgi:hypothetical protein